MGLADTAPQANVVVNFHAGDIPASEPSAPPAPEGGVDAVMPAAPVPAPAAAAASTGLLAIKCTPEFEEMTLEQQTMLSMIDITAPASDASDQITRAPVEICAVIDRSGSMRVKKLALVLQSLEFVARELTSQDKLSIVAYDQSVRRVMPTTSMTPANRKKAIELLKSIKPGGSTNLSGGLLAGLKEVRESGSPPLEGGKTVSKTVWLFTDGQATCGIKSTDGILEAMNDYLGESTDMTVYTFGFGDTHKDEMLRSVAEAGSGMYYYLQQPDEIPGCFAECLGGLLNTVASDITVSFTPSRGVEVIKVPEDPSVKLDNVQIKYKDLYGDEVRNILLELKLNKLEVPNTQVVGCAKVSWKTVTGEVREVETALSIDRMASIDDQEHEADDEIHVHRLRLDAADAMSRARTLADEGNMSAANSVVKQMRVQSEAYAAELDCKYDREKTPSSASVMEKRKKKKALVSHLCDDMGGLEEQMTSSSMWHAQGRKAMGNAEMAHRKQRASKGAKESAYSVPSQKAMVQKVTSLFK